MAWYTSKRGWVAGVAAVVYFFLDHYGYLGSIAEIYRFSKSHWPTWFTISPFIAPALFVLAIVFFEMERRKAKYVNPKTLKARALRVRDQMQSFLDSLGEKPMGFLDGESPTEYIVRTSNETGRRWNLLGHYYELN